MTKPDRLPPTERLVREDASAPTAPLTGGPYALVCMGWVPWGTSWKRNQSMVYELSRLGMFNRVVFVNPRALWVPFELSSGHGSLGSRLGRLAKSLPHTYDRRIRICNKIHFMPFKAQFPVGFQFEDWLFRALVRVLRGGGPFVVLNNHPSFFSRSLLVELMEKSALSVFDMSDDFVEFFQLEAHRRHLEENIAFCCSRSDLVFTINEHVRDKYAQHNPNTYVIPNATNYFNFDRPTYRRVPFLEKVRALGQPILGYTGIINHVRIDYDLLETVLQRRTDCQFVFVGSADESFDRIVSKYEHVHYHRQVHYRVLPDWIAYFDAAIVPFQVNEHTRGNDLLKFNDYLAMGKSIVTTNTGGAEKYDELIRVASDADGFLAAVDLAIGETSPELAEVRKRTARANSWDHRAQEIEVILRKHLAQRDREASS